ncbi:hypothetical protein [Rummeliibacillus pycnus]|uniref:hypothetical protein n=1 Tax=Rummeliibacillus pycnus TaxID=101070 RepID=UPI000C9A6F22|nr:hypothetical protein [Rummeliibacillus pycnus]
MENKQRKINLTIESTGELREWYVFVEDSAGQNGSYHFKDAGAAYAMYKTLHRCIKKGYGYQIEVTSNHEGFIRSLNHISDDNRTLSRMTRDILFETNSVITSAKVAE